eukprot:5595590-Pleurochrysis_carterae.AAC.1
MERNSQRRSAKTAKLAAVTYHVLNASTDLNHARCTQLASRFIPDSTEGRFRPHTYASGSELTLFNTYMYGQTFAQIFRGNSQMYNGGVYWWRHYLLNAYIDLNNKSVITLTSSLCIALLFEPWHVSARRASVCHTDVNNWLHKTTASPSNLMVWRRAQRLKGEVDGNEANLAT